MTPKVGITIIAGLLTAGSLSAAEQLLEVETFSGVSIGTGMHTKITCGHNNQVNLRGDKSVIDAIEVSIDNDILTIERKTSAGKIFSNLMNNNRKEALVEVDIITNGQLSVIETSTGADIDVPDCAVNSSMVRVDASTGSNIKLQGMTAELNLDMSTGSQFNHKTSGFVADHVTVDMSTGAIANLCGATRIEGDASTGALISASASADTDGLDLSLGADKSSKRCK